MNQRQERHWLAITERDRLVAQLGRGGWGYPHRLRIDTLLSTPSSYPVRDYAPRPHTIHGMYTEAP